MIGNVIFYFPENLGLEFEYKVPLQVFLYRQN